MNECVNACMRRHRRFTQLFVSGVAIPWCSVLCAAWAQDSVVTNITMYPTCMRNSKQPALILHEKTYDSDDMSLENIGRIRFGREP